LLIFHCVKENLIIIWKKGAKIVTLGDKPYEDDDKRIQVESVWREANKTLDADKVATEEKRVQVGNTLVIRLSEENECRGLHLSSFILQSCGAQTFCKDYR